ncbi:DUF3987 domain-containing protein [Bartonella krasnovii]|uniref:DUF3987 domain-containing protein n=1 Tax=Bartonella krasnovii TaxID=2267275 RepID=A0ABY3VWJ8_9HYPH|nr:DUF3987 domain-containing protein [Bartonella krasnovii]UNF29719.1 DUF3987 domain-containing protein [Bartonella krasnovii]UNF36079.1 DUF3987 domain-containing protein [Bartonella krasnovii]UNF37734.1 DUF3987 domain-containing protein [Bartonella krasnovii]UNF49265.1 DUF3987 domain-containing protein [Bartonella krasnovii]UNF52622.1 DUF3987 domain-containing protein [Bartonella krasnovii]
MNKTIPTLALIFELSEGEHFEINRDALERALCWEKYLLSHAKRLYAARDTLTAERAKLIVERCDHLLDVLRQGISIFIWQQKYVVLFKVFIG